MTTSVLRVDVEPDETGSLMIRWELDGPATAVDVAVGPTPDRIDHRHAVVVDEGTTATRLADLGPGRHFVSVAPHGGGGAVVGALRRVQFDGLQNFRDLGGYPTSGGARTRWGLVFRSDSLHKLTAADRLAFEHLGMKAIYDLRGDDEREANPNPFESIHLAIIGSPRRDERGVVESLTGIADGERMLRDLYVGMLEHSADLFGHLLQGFADPGGLPAVFHCHAGKDRTGMAAALLLLALGVGRGTVLDDYELTRRYRTFEHQTDSFERLTALGLRPEAAAGVLSAPRWAMAEALDEVETVHGGIDAYLTGPAGLQAADINRLRDALTE